MKPQKASGLVSALALEKIRFRTFSRALKAGKACQNCFRLYQSGSSPSFRPNFMMKAWKFGPLTSSAHNHQILGLGDEMAG